MELKCQLRITVAEVKHILIKSEVELEKLQGSKYVQKRCEAVL